MKGKTKKRKGFTIVELIIVIAVIGVLAAILIPTFANVIKKSNFTSCKSTVKNLNTAIVSETAEYAGTEACTLEQALALAEKAGFAEEATKTDNKDYDVVWIGQVGKIRVNKFAIIDRTTNDLNASSILFPEEAVTAAATMPKEWFNSANLQSTSVERKTSIADCDWTGEAYVALEQDEDISAVAHTLTGEWAIDLNGHTITLGAAGRINVDGGSLTISDSTGTGKILSTDARIVAYNDGKITINGGQLITEAYSNAMVQVGKVEAGVNSKALVMLNNGSICSPNGAPCVVVFGPDARFDVYDGSINAMTSTKPGWNFGFYAIAGNGSNGFGGTTINIYGGTITSHDGPTIYQPQEGTLNIHGGTIKSILSDGYDNVCDAINVKSGTVNITGGTISTNAKATPAETVRAYSNGEQSIGSALGVVSNDNYAGEVIINISGGTFVSSNGYAFSQILSQGSGTSVVKIDITGGIFIGYGDYDIFVTTAQNVTTVAEGITARVRSYSFQ